MSLPVHAVAGLWAEVLGLPHVGEDDELARYGADSLDTARVVSRLRRSFGIEVPFRVVYEAATPRALAMALAGSRPSTGAPLAAGGHRALWPLSRDQQRLWLLERHGVGGAAYHVPVSLRLDGPLDVDALRAALDGVVARHGSLRTRFVVDGHEPRQQVLPAWPCELPLVESAPEPDDTPFDLGRAAPWRVALHRIAADRHVLAFVFHHIVFDDWSREVLLRELGELYAARCEGREPRLPELPVQCTDHALWQRERGEAGSPASLDYWRGQLAGVTPLDLPADRPRPATWTGTGADYEFTIDRSLAAAVRALAAAHRATPSMALLAAWSVLLGRLCGTDDVAVGASAAERESPELEGLIGMFVNVLVIRTGLAGRPGFGHVLDAVRETTLDAFAHRDLASDRLAAELGPDRTVTRNALCNVDFGYLDRPAADENWPGLRVRRLRPPATSSAFDLILTVQAMPDGSLLCRLVYATDLFDGATIERLGRRYRRLVAGLVADPDRPVHDVDLLGDDERRELLVEFNAATAPLPDECLHQVVERTARRTPDAIAVACGSRTLTYAELDTDANQLAHHLRGQGVGPETPVAIRLPRSVDQIVAMLAVWKAGGYYVALDDEHPADRIDRMLTDAQPLVLITRGAERIAAGERAGVAKAVCLDRDRGPMRDLPTTAPDDVEVPVTALAAAIYTSGSTGAPKAVALTHRNVVAAQVSRDAYEAPPVSMLLPVSFAFDVFLTFACWTLRDGGKVVVPVQARGADLDELAALVCAERVTHLCATPDTQRALLAREDVRAGNHLVLGIVGGQSCPQLVVDDYARWAPSARVVNEYGLTETSYGTFFLTSGPGEDTSLPIGRPAANCRVYLLDGGVSPVPAGVTGELYVGGPGIARGYLGRPDLTAERFVPDPLGEPGQRLYRTGDLGRLRPDGNIEFLGRRDRQVKVRGFRIELAEIEAALVSHRGVASAAVCFLADRQELVGYVEPRPGAATREDELRRHLQRRLPDPMVPATIVTLPRLPQTPTGKIDRTALAALPVERPTEPERTAPRTPAERTVAAVWAQALEVPEVDIHTDFFKLGGHSLLAATVVSRLRAEFDVTLGLQDLFGSPTVAGLAELIGARMLEALQSRFGGQVIEKAAEPERADPAAPQGTAASQPAEPVAPVEPGDGPIAAVRRDGPAPLSAGQLQMWLVDRIHGGSRAYQVPLALRLTGRLDVLALRSALDRLVGRHEVLRTRVAIVADEPVQVVEPPRPIELSIVDSTREGLDELLDAVVARPFDLTADVMVRATLVRLAAQEHVLALVLHHIASDGGSVGVLVDELAWLYGELAAGRPAQLPPPPIQYSDFATWYHRRADGEQHVAQLAYWRRQLAGVAPLRLPTDRPAPARPDFAGRAVDVVIDAGLAAEVGELAARHGATRFMVLLTAFKILLGRLGAGPDLAVGVPVYGRDRPELERLVGYFGNMIVLRTRIDQGLTCEQALDRVKDVTAAGLANQEVSFARVVEHVAPQRSLSAAPLFNVMFAYDLRQRPLPGIGDLDTSEVRLPVRAAQFDLTLRFADRLDGSVHGRLEYATALFDEPTIAALADGFMRVLDAMLSRPESAVEALPLLDPAEADAIAAWNDTARDYDLEPLPGLVAAQVARTPDAPAMFAGGRWSTYGQFAAGVNRLARHLLEPAGPLVDRVVGVCLPRGGDLVTAVHAVVAAGAAYLPLPPDVPDSRLAGMAADAGAVAVVTTAEHAGRFAGVPVVCLDTDREAIATHDAGPLDVDVPLDALAYVIFTSGSTGRPKGVGVSHRAIANRLLWMQETFPLDANDRVLHKTPFSFDVSVWELFWPLLTGAGMVVADDGAHRDFVGLAGLARATAVTTAHFVPSILRLFLDELGESARIPSLRRVVCSGEALTADLVARFRAALPGVELHNLYGPTEAAVDVSWHPCDGSEVIVPIGRPVANTRLEVLDARGERVPVGVPGELCIGGVQVARGYAGRPDLTAERFVPDPFGEPGSRRYRTGDLARWRRDGAIEYLGRLDHQIKIRGVRIEPGEIEAVLGGHPDLAGAAVVAADGGSNGTDATLVAYVVSHAWPAPEAAELRDYLCDRLPAAMIPAQFVELPAFPLTASGKLDRKTLPEPSASAAVVVRPRNDTERTIAAIWAALLGVARVGAFDDFFALGGNSIRAVQAAGRMAAAGLAVSVQDVFVHRTVAALAALAGSTGRSADEPARALSWLRRDGDRPPVVCVHPGDGSAHWFAELSRLLDEPVAAFEWPGIRGDRWPPEGEPVTVEWIAGRYVAELRESRPAGPYRLLGWCGGAAVAWEMARRLGAGEVELYLLDPVVDVGDRANFLDQLDQFDRCEALFAELATSADPNPVRERIVSILRLAIDDADVPVDDDAVNAQWRARLRGWRQLLRANIDYTFRPYDGDLHLLVGDELRRSDHLVTYGLGYRQYVERWRELATGGTSTHEVGGDHFGVLRRPHVADLAELLTVLRERR